jgi:hypothetical protein
VEHLKLEYQVRQASEPAVAWWLRHERERPLEERPALLQMLEPLFATWRQLREPRPAFLDAVHDGAVQSGARRLEAQLSFALPTAAAAGGGAGPRAGGRLSSNAGVTRHQ